jgi:hypothetical protein
MQYLQNAKKAMTKSHDDRGGHDDRGAKEGFLAAR